MFLVNKSDPENIKEVSSFDDCEGIVFAFGGYPEAEAFAKGLIAQKVKNHEDTVKVLKAKKVKVK